ncbi:alpha/beta hydrolase [Dongia rigui]|uniref:Alpha/beta hydrolase n=1 Tax=Dongia rigui TaxID=940149 RepID=A0ABU5DZX4_9PROT|nr:alpha/beta hydrolase [Dongia rigui]MDY0872894.1 alpha/beta hydrolase [Dongia rigui]
MLLGVVIAAAVAYLAALFMLYTKQRKIVFKPNPTLAVLADYPAPSGLNPVTNRNADGLDIVSWYLPARRDDGRAIAYFHGNAGHHGDRVARIIPYAAEGYGILLVGYRGYGGNPGQPTEAGLYTDARAALDFLQDQGVKPDQLILFGESLGSAVATQMATERAARALILEAPFASILRSARQRYRYLAFDFLVRDKFDTLAKIGRVGKPLLVIHGDLDRTTPAYFGHMVFEAAKEPKQGFFPKDAGHTDLMQHGMPAAVLGFLDALGQGPK